MIDTALRIELKTSWTEEDTEFPMVAVMEVTLPWETAKEALTADGLASEKLQKIISSQIKEDIDLSVGQDYLLQPFNGNMPWHVSHTLQLQSLQVYVRTKTLEDFTVLKLKYYG
jgi:hypothetical protein